MNKKIVQQSEEPSKRWQKDNVSSGTRTLDLSQAQQPLKH
jgi:hypothetical protein